MNNNIIFNEEYLLPYFTKGASSMTDADYEEYLDQMKAIFINNLEFYYKGRNTHPLYSNKTFDYFSDSEDDFPCFCFGQIYPSSSGGYSSVFGITPCLKSNGEYFPYNPPTTYCSTKDRVALQSYNNVISFNCPTNAYPYAEADCRPAVRYIKFKDGRKVIVFKNKTISTDKNIYYGINGCLYYTNIKYNDENISENKKWIIFSDAPNTSYIPEIDSTASLSQGNLIHNDYYHYLNPRYMLGCGGIIPDKIAGKEFLLKLSNYYIGDEYYLKEVSFFSKLLNIDNNIPVGSIITIENKDYVVLNNYMGIEGKNLSVAELQKWSAPFTTSIVVPTNLDGIEEDQSLNNDDQSLNNDFDISFVDNDEIHYHDDLEEDTPSFNTEG